MRKKKLIVTLGVAVLTSLAACGTESGNVESSSKEQSSVSISSEETTTSSESISSIELTSSSEEDNDETLIRSYVQAALRKLDELVNPAISNVSNEDLKLSIQVYYDGEKIKINAIIDLESAKNAVNLVIEDTKAFIRDTLKPLAIEKINAIINPLIQKISYEELRTSVQSFYDVEMSKVSSAESLKDVVDVFKEIVDDTKKFIVDETEKTLIALKNKALQELDPYVTALINKIPFETLKADTQTFYNQEKKLLEAVDTIEGIGSCVTKIKEDLESFALTEAKKIAVSKLNEVVQEGIAKIPNPELKADLNSFASEEINKLNAITKVEDVASTFETVVTETVVHIKTLMVSTVREYIRRLIGVENATAYDYLPEAMRPDYQQNLVTSSNINYVFSSFVNVFDINKAGFGEQWQMVIENIEQSVAMAKVFNIAQTALNAAGNAVDIYLTNSYADEMSYSFSGSGFTGLFEFKNAKLVFNISMTQQFTIPVVGTVSPTIKMEYDLTNETKNVYIKLGDSYKINYLISDNRYEMATTYGVTISGVSGSRTSYLSIDKTNSQTTGHIYEYTTLEGKDAIKACADFYIKDGYVSVVGNKASGMVAFAGYINELYLANQGRLIGYEVREVLTIAGISGTYNTIWFNLWDIDGINTIKVTDKTSANKSGKSTVDVYLNGSSTLLSPTYNYKSVVKTSRKYDVEFRNRYYYSYDAENDKYISNEVQVPMFFIQQGENFNSFSSDILSDNNISASVSLSSTYLNKILSDYATLIDVFIINKENMSSEAIIAYLEK